MTESLPPFTPIGKARCEMCGSQDIGTHYMASGRCLHYRTGHAVIDSAEARENPRQHRECNDCGNAWDERTLKDSPETRSQMLKDSFIPMSNPQTGEFS